MKLITDTVAAIVVLGLIGWIAAEPANALEIRTSEEGILRIEANETIDDTLMAFGRSVEVDGTIRGDLITFAQTVVIRGSVEGNLVTGAQTVTINGDVGGTVLGAAQTVNVATSAIGGNFFGFSNTIDAADTTSIDQNAVVFSGQANLAGPVGRDVISFGSQVEVGGSVGGNLRTFGPNVSVLGPARIGGDFEADAPSEDGISVSPGATIVGDQTINIRESQEGASKYANAGWYGSQLLRFATAFVTGLVMLLIVPGFRNVAITGVGNGFATAGIGLVALVSTPIIALLALFTMIGVPLALFSAMLFLALLYLAKIVLAFFVSRKFFESRGTSPHFSLTLAAGLAVLIVVVNLPFIGGILNFVCTVVGLGLIVMFLFAQMKKLSGPKEAAT